MSPEDWVPQITDLAAPVRRDIPRIRSILEQLGIRNAEYEDPSDFVASAMLNALGRNRLRAFQAELARAGLIEASGEVIAQELLTRLVSLQSFVSAVYTPVDAVTAVRQLLLALHLVCRIEVDDDHAGSGVLITPGLVATAGHVVAPLVEVRNGKPVAAPGSLMRVRVSFTDVNDVIDGALPMTKLPTTTATLADDWLVHYSPPGPTEIGQAFVVDSIDGIDVTTGPWDVAILRLASKRQVGHMTLRERIPRKPFQIHVLHHPADDTGTATPLLWSIGSVEKRLGDPPVRLLHSANTKNGSSGAPVFDRDFRIIGLHQAGQPNAPAAGEAGANRAIPLSPWSAELASFEVEDSPIRAVELIDDTGVRVVRTVIGRRETQSRLYRSAGHDATAQERLLIVAGEPGLGLRFTKHLVRTIVAPLGGAYAALDIANCQQDDATSFSKKIAGAFAASERVSAYTGLTTRQREIRNRMAPNLARTLGAVAGSDGAWLVLEGFERTAERPPAVVVDLITQLMEELPSCPGLRLVLVGWQDPIPLGYEESFEYLEQPTSEDVALACLPIGARSAPDGLIEFAEDAMKRAGDTIPDTCPYHIAEAARLKLHETFVAPYAPEDGS